MVTKVTTCGTYQGEFRHIMRLISLALGDLGDFSPRIMQNLILYRALLLVLYTDFVCTSCTYPWGAGPWADSLGRTTITFNTNTNMQGYDLNYLGTSFSEWTCLFKTGNLILSRTSTTGNVAGDDFYLYACMLVNTVSSTKFYYHLMSETDNLITKPGSNKAQRIAAKVNLVTDICGICAQDPSSITLPVTEYIVMTSDGTSTGTDTISNPSFAPNPCDPSTTTTQATTTTQPPTTTTTTQPPTTTTTQPPTTTTTQPPTTTTTTQPPTTTTTQPPTTTTTQPPTTTTTQPPTTTTTTQPPTTTTTQPPTTTTTQPSNMSPLMTTLVNGNPWVQAGTINTQFTPTQITGMPVTITGQVQSSWLIVKEEPDLLLCRSDKLFNINGQLKYGFLCMVITYTDADHVNYYLWSERAEQYSSERIHFSANAEATPADCCCVSSDIPGESEYKMLSKQGVPQAITSSIQKPRGKLPKCYNDEEDDSVIFSIIFGIPALVLVLGLIVLIRNCFPQVDVQNDRPTQEETRGSRSGSRRSTPIHEDTQV